PDLPEEGRLCHARSVAEERSVPIPILRRLENDAWVARRIAVLRSVLDDGVLTGPRPPHPDFDLLLIDDLVGIARVDVRDRDGAVLRRVAIGVPTLAVDHDVAVVIGILPDRLVSALDHHLAVWQDVH